MTFICVPVMAPTCETMAREAEAAARAGADMIELRLDFLKLNTWHPKELASAIHQARSFGKPLIATCRIAAEGGQFAGSDTDRMILLNDAAAFDKRGYVDVEYETWRHSPHVHEATDFICARRSLARLILSRHDFERTPADLDRHFEELLATPAAVVKLVCKAESIVDSLRMLDALRKARHSRDVIALSMGEAGILTRVLAKKFDALLTFAAMDTGKESAPGQPTIGELRGLYRWDAINAGTKVYGVIGCPVAHSMSPAIHNAAFGAVGHDGVYLPMRVEPPYQAFAAFLDGCLTRPWLDLHGLSVTIPHKENLLRYVEAHGGEIEPLTRRIGVANTLLIEPYGTGVSRVECGTGVSPVEMHRPDAGATSDPNTGETPVPHVSARVRGPRELRAFNTDYRGALDALCAGLECEPKDLAAVPVAVLGAGGASRAIVAGLCDCGCAVTIYNRTAERAVALARDFGAAALPWDQRVKPGTRIIVNCTSIGMWPNVDETPLLDLPTGSDTAVFDTVYNPIETRLLRDARQAGIKTIDGVAMFVGQAAAQFECWTGKPAPTELMRRVVVRRLTSRDP